MPWRCASANTRSSYLWLPLRWTGAGAFICISCSAKRCCWVGLTSALAKGFLKYAPASASASWIPCIRLRLDFSNASSYSSSASPPSANATIPPPAMPSSVNIARVGNWATPLMRGDSCAMISSATLDCGACAGIDRIKVWRRWISAKAKNCGTTLLGFFA